MSVFLCFGVGTPRRRGSRPARRCPGTNTLRSSSQLVCVLVLAGFQATFVWENRYTFADAAPDGVEVAVLSRE